MRYEGLKQKIETIDGWLSNEDKNILIESVNKLKDGSTIVEIGSWKGKSSTLMGLILKEKNYRNTTIHCIDPFTGSIEHGRVDTYTSFLNNITKFSVKKYIKSYKMTSEEANKNWNKKIDMIFIDGEHQYKFVKKDILLWSKFLREGGFILLHDSFGFKGVTKAIKKHIYRKNTFKNINFRGAITYANKVEKLSLLDKLKNYYNLIIFSVSARLYRYESIRVFGNKMLKLFGKKV